MIGAENNFNAALRFAGKVMVITGAASGIGRAVALRAVSEGAQLALIDINNEAGKQVLQEVERIQNGNIFVQADLAKSQNVKNAFEQVIAEFGHINIAINNAGIMGTPNPVHLLTDEQIEQTLSINLKSIIYCAREEVKWLLQNGGGSIVNNASMAGLVGMPNSPMYTATKHGVNGLTRNMALDYADFGIRVNSVNPGPTKTAMTEKAGNFMEKAKEDISQWNFRRIKEENLQHRKASAEEQAASILFLASDDASHITGTLFATDGGWTAF